MPDTVYSQVWRIVALSGCGLTAMGFTAFSLGTIFSEFHSFTLYLWMIGLGLLGLLIGVVGQVFNLDRQKRRKISALLIFGPLAVCVVVGFIDTNLHGVFPLFVIASIPIWLLGIVVFLTSFVGRSSGTGRNRPSSNQP